MKKKTLFIPIPENISGDIPLNKKRIMNSKLRHRIYCTGVASVFGKHGSNLDLYSDLIFQMHALDSLLE